MGMSPVPTGTPITQEFGAYPGGYNPWGGHTGRDYGAWTGTNAVAIADGVVRWADWCYNLPGGAYGWEQRWFFDLAFGGIIVVIEHDDVLATYSHMSATHLNPGDYVRKGEFIGRTGNTGAATSGDHLHFEIIAKPFNWGNGTFGRVHPGPYIREPYLTSTAGDTALPSTGGTGTTTEEDWFDMATKDELRAVIRDEVRNATWVNDQGKTETLNSYLVWHLQKIRESIDSTPDRVWDEPTALKGSYNGKGSKPRTTLEWFNHERDRDRAQVLALRGEVAELQQTVAALVDMLKAQAQAPTTTFLDAVKESA